MLAGLSATWMQTGQAVLPFVLAALCVLCCWVWTTHPVADRDRQRMRGRLARATVVYGTCLTAIFVIAWLQSLNSTFTWPVAGFAAVVGLWYATAFDPEQRSWYHHRRVRLIYVVGMLGLVAAGVILTAPYPAALPVLVSAWVCHQHFSAQHELIAKSLSDIEHLHQKILRDRGNLTAVTVSSNGLQTAAKPQSQPADDKVPRAG